MALAGLALVILGVVYIWKPTIFRRGIWMKTSIAIRTLSDSGYQTYMQSLGAICIVAGLLLMIFGHK